MHDFSDFTTGQNVHVIDHQYYSQKLRLFGSNRPKLNLMKVLQLRIQNFLYVVSDLTAETTSGDT